MRHKISTLLFAICLSISGSAIAENIQLVFFYPGGQGSQAEAQVLLDDFSQLLKKASGGKLNNSIKYFSDARAGEAFIQKQKPIGGIIAWDLFQEKAKVWQAEEILQTQQLPSADGTNQYFIIGAKDKTLPSSGSITLISSRPFSSKILKEKLFSKNQQELQLKTSPNIVGQLRKIGKGTIEGWVLLDQFEYTNIARLKSDWAKNLEIKDRSAKIPSAPFVVFKNNLSDEQTALLKKSLLKLSKDRAAAETLNMFRIKGFQE